MASGIQRTQLDWIQSSNILGIGLSVIAGSTNVSTALATLLSTAGRGSVSVPVQVSTADNVIGLITSGINNKVTLRNSTTKDVIRQGEEEVYGRLTNSSSVYTLTYFYNNNGTETAYSFGSTTSIDFVVSYRFDAARFPVDALIAVTGALLANDVTGSGTPALFFAEPLTIVTLNTVPNITKTPFNNQLVHLTVNGAVYWSSTSNPAFTISGKVITWNAANSFPLLPGYDVVACYTTIE